MDEQFKKFNMKKFLDNLKNTYGKNITFDEKLSKYSWFNLGGPAEIFFKPANIQQLSLFIKQLRDRKQPINILGAGSNTLIRDGGIKGATIKLGPQFSYMNILKDNIIQFGAATLDITASNYAAKNSLSGIEFLSCIPGSIGGAIKMNSGCYGYEISKILDSLEVMDENGNLKIISADKIKFSYRNCDLPKTYIIVSANLRTSVEEKKLIINKQNELIKRKKEAQPSQIKTCGSTFKNTEQYKAWELIKKSDCENLFFGEAKISEKHCNFFVNSGKASSTDIEQLIKKVKNEVLKKTGIKLELEIKLIGDEKKIQ